MVSGAKDYTAPMSRLAFIVAIVCVFAACHARVAAAQGDFTARGLHAGDHVLVTLESGTPSKGTVTDVSATRLMLDGFLVDPADVRKIERLGDPLWNGALLGVLVGAFVGQDDQFGCATNRAARLRCARTPAIALGLLGGLMDYARVGRRTVFERAPRVTLSAGPRGVHLALRWAR